MESKVLSWNVALDKGYEPILYSYFFNLNSVGEYTVRTRVFIPRSQNSFATHPPLIPEPITIASCVFFSIPYPISNQHYCTKCTIY